MSGMRMLALVLIVAGVLGLAYGGFTYTKDTHETKLGPIEISVKPRKKTGPGGRGKAHGSSM